MENIIKTLLCFNRSCMKRKTNETNLVFSYLCHVRIIFLVYKASNGLRFVHLYPNYISNCHQYRSLKYLADFVDRLSSKHEKKRKMNKNK
jgi:hypothetical protein